MSQDQRLYDFFDGDPDNDLEYHQDYSEPWAAVLRPSFILPLLLAAIPVIYQILYKLDYDLLPIPELLWNILVYLVPSRLLDAIERYRSPLRIANPMFRNIPRTHAMKAESMRRILGLDTPEGIMGSVAQAGRRRLSTLSGINFTAKGAEGRPAGLGNWDNSCYQNSVLQGLASLDSLSGYLTNPVVERDTMEGVEKPNMRMADALRGLIATLNDPSNNEKRIWTPASLKNMSSIQQQDAQEYFSKVLDEVDKEISKVAKLMRTSQGFEKKHDSSPEDSKVFPLSTFRNPLEGMMAQRVGCTRCGYSEGLTMTPFNCLTVPLGRAWEYDIAECLDESTKLEQITGVECGKCTLLKSQRQLETIAERVKELSENEPLRKTTAERLAAVTEALEDDDYEEKTLVNKCKIRPKSRVASTKTRQGVIARPPKSLVVHFNRSLFDELTGELTKNYAEVRFPKILDLGPWCLGSSGIIRDLESEEWILDPDKPMIASSARISRLRGPLYELRAVVTHYGRHENGHYVCYKKHPTVSDDEKEPVKEQWWRLSDDDVMKVSEENVLGQSGVFMLFFDLVEPAKSVPAEQTGLEGHHLNQYSVEAASSNPFESKPVELLPTVEQASPEDLDVAANVPLPELNDSDLSDSDLPSESIQTTREESLNTSISDCDEEESMEPEQNGYSPTKAIVVPPYIQQPGVHNNEGEETGKQGIVPSGNLVMV